MLERAHDFLAQAKAAESQAVSDGSLDDCVAAREQEDAALEAIARAEARASKFPVNFAASATNFVRRPTLVPSLHVSREGEQLIASRHPTRNGGQGA